MSAVKICPDCNGRGWIYEYKLVEGAYQTREIECATCHRAGLVPLTNADVIRRLSDEELADLFADWDFCSDVCSQQYSDNPLVGKCPENCKEQALKWLRQPAKEGD